MRIHKSILFSAILAAGMFSCEDLVDLKPESTITTESFWEDEGDVQSATYGMYNMFRSTFDVKTVIWGEFRTGFYGQGSSTATNWNDLWQNTMTPTSVGTNWSTPYMLINDANLILSKAPAIEFRDEVKKNHVLGQAYFVRAFTYFYIARIWGDAPIVTEGFESTDQELEPARRPKAEVFQQAKDDVAQAISLLGDREGVNYIGKDAANMLKAEIYLWTAKLENGGEADLKEAQAAIDDVLEAGYVLEDNFETVFRNELSPEIIFSIYYSDLENGAGGTSGSGGRAIGTHPSHITLPSVELTPDNLESEVPVKPQPQWLDLSAFFINDFLNASINDSRTPVTHNSAGTGGQTVTWINKYIGEVFAGTRVSSSDLIIYRFADAVLIKAEIENALGNTPEALIHLNKIAKRAYGVDNYFTGLNEAQVDEAILNQRILEFVLEGKSWFDIQRFGKAFEMIPTLVGRASEHKGNILLFPVAQDVINRNRNIVQTDGYN